MSDPRPAGPGRPFPSGPAVPTGRAPAAPPVPAGPSVTGQGWAPARPAGTPGLRDSRADLRPALVTVVALAASGLVAGGLWLWLAPRADYRVTDADVVPVDGPVSAEIFMADDGVFVLVLAALGLLAGLAGWFLLRRHRGALTLAALATGSLAAGVVAWQLGEWLGAGPTEADLTEVGATVTTGLSLGAAAALAVGPFFAVLAYVVAAVLDSRDDLGRPGDDVPAAVPSAPRPPLPPVPPPAPRS
ncbi:hypothetical protein [Modestobacter italicus]|uniref:hypothetical protein n=1 Tax=Modestobacter italicus (strain DSM 44449 / CECT 9708 / BC 501) TaxID=2732864 RepID=UPI001C944E77|nr:hypothetical protein [Modestobacter italicus]